MSTREREAGEVRFPMALRLVDLFKIMAVLVLIGAVIAAIAGGVNLGQETDSLGNHINSGGAVAGYVAVVTIGVMVIASIFGFFAYVLEILVAAYSELWNIRVENEDEDVD
jgi:amino acid permease